MQFPFAGHLRDQLAGFGELADGRFQFTGDVWRNDQLRLHDLLRLLHAGIYPLLLRLFDSTIAADTIPLSPEVDSLLVSSDE